MKPQRILNTIRYDGQEYAVTSLDLENAVKAVDEWVKNPENKFDWGSWDACVAGIYYGDTSYHHYPQKYIMSDTVFKAVRNAYPIRFALFFGYVSKSWPMVRKAIIKQYQLSA